MTAVSKAGVSASPLRIVQWTTGNVGKQALRAVIDRPDLELVGLFTLSAEKVGRDAGELAGLDAPLGFGATDNIQDIVALKPDCVAYMPLSPDVDHLVTLLRAGINVVTTSEFLTGRGLGDAAIATLQEAGESGRASLFGSGVNPGWVECVAAIVSAPSRSIQRVRVLESFDLSLIADEANQDDFGWGREADTPGHAEEIVAAVYEFNDAVDLLARLFRVELDDVRCEVVFAHAVKDLEVPGRTVLAGTVAGIQVTWFGAIGAVDVIELIARWTMTGELDQSWEVLNGYRMQLLGDPTINLTLEFEPGAPIATIDDIKALGHRVTAMPAINAIPYVVAAAPGIVTYAELPAMTAPIVTA
jgi:hypothetical protein